MATFTGKVPAWQKKYKTQMEAFEAESTEPMFNIQSNVHLNKLFFDALEETPLSRTPTGKPQVNEDFLDHIAAKYSWAADLVVYNKLSKLNGTYIARFLDEAIDDIWYPDFKQHGTTSGRYSGDAQQLPRVIPPEDIEMHDSRVVKYTNMIRSFFIARPGHMLCSSDYNQLEPSVFAHVSGDVPLQKIFHEGLDFYSEVAIRTENLTGVSSHKKADNYLGKVSKTARQNAKAYALGLAYGMTGYKLKFTINTSEAEANNLVQQYYIAFPNLKALIDKSRYDAETKGFVISQAGRVRHLPDAKRIFEQYGEAIRDDLQLWKKYNGTSLYKQAKLDRKVYKNAVNNAMNFQIQGLAASIMNKAAIKLARVIKSEGLNTLILANVHDELILDVPESEINIVGPLVKQIMQDTTKLSVPLVVDPQFGNSYDQCK
jgi:DNA polymerase-1